MCRVARWKVVDTVGAGDAFAVGVISGLLDGLDVVGAVRRACWIGACQVQVLGTRKGCPRALSCKPQVIKQPFALH